MIKVYFGTAGYSELAAVFDDEDVYDLCIHKLKAFAFKHGMTITESITEEKIEKYENLQSKTTGNNT